MLTKKPSWSQIKTVLAQKKPKEILKLVGDLYRLSKDNRVFIESRFLPGEDALIHYKQVIADALYPDVYKNKPIRLSVGKKAISDYRKATSDDLGVLELMVHYLEQGNDFTAEYGDIDSQFYDSLCTMLDRILDMLTDQNAEVLDEYVPRRNRSAAPQRGWQDSPESVATFVWNQWQDCRGMGGSFAMESVAGFVRNTQQVVIRASGIGWGYHDYISDQWEQFLEGLDES